MTTMRTDNTTNTELNTQDMELQYVYVPLNAKESHSKENIYNVPYWKYAEGLVTQRYYGDKCIVPVPYVVQGSQTVIGSTPRVTPIIVSRSQSLPRVTRHGEGKALEQADSLVLSETRSGEANVVVHGYLEKDTKTKKKHKKHKRKHHRQTESKAVDTSVQTVSCIAGKESEKHTIDLEDDISLSSKRLETGSIASRITHNYYTGEQLIGVNKEHNNASLSTSPYISYKGVGGRSAGYMYHGSTRMSGGYHHGEMNTLSKKGWMSGNRYTRNAEKGWVARYLYAMNSGMFGYRADRSRKYGIFRIHEIKEGKTTKTILSCCGCTCGTRCLPLQVIIIVLFLLLIIFTAIFTISLLV